MIEVYAGLPKLGGALPAAAKSIGCPVMVSANAFWRPATETFRTAPDLAGLTVVLDSAGFVAMARYGGYRWSVEQYVELAAQLDPRWWPSMDYCCEPEAIAAGAWPELVGVGSVCRRRLHGENGLLAVIDALGQHLPPHARLHLFGVKSGALDYLATWSRVASVDSMAWDLGSRMTGAGTMKRRAAALATWYQRQTARASRSSSKPLQRRITL